ncbi:MAG TPA: tyrosine-type recombinase/integrase [Candidatus Dormibacteraeota bacterium]|nr:tyrosine-type recombinase/integrase [Candidatus Dormibacteraeota bacterium]
MLTIFRRHLKTCEHRSEGRAYRRCHCPISVEGFIGEKSIRAALKTADWQRASDTVRQWEAEQQICRQNPVSIADAAEKFLADTQSRNLAEQTIYKYDLLFRRLKDFARRGGYTLLRELDADALTRFRLEWKDGPRASQKKLERLRAFFRFCQRRRWTAENPASELKMPKITALPTLPFTHDEMVKVLAAAEKYGAQSADNAKLNAIRIRSLVLVMRYSGLRIGDAVSLSLDRLSGNTLFLYTAKTGTPVRVSLPEFVAEALRVTPPMNDRYWFWTGQSKLSTATTMWQGRLRSLFRLAGATHGHAHRFRDTFAVELLLAGVPLERLSVLLGHSSIRVTERHYSPWVEARQAQAEADLQRAWSRDPLVLMQTNHTPDTRGKGERLN